MRHASPAELVDLAEGVDRPAIQAHLDRCVACADQLSQLRLMLAGHAADAAGDDADDLWARAGEVPEPSPLFWTYFPRRVSRALEQAVDQEPRWRDRARLSLMWPWLAPALAASLIVGLAIGVGVSSRSQDAIDGQTPTAPSGAVAVVREDPQGGQLGERPDGEDPGAVSTAADPGWAMLLLMTDTTLWNEDDSAGLFVTDGAAERAVFELSSAEREELRRLLESEIGDRSVETS